MAMKKKTQIKMAVNDEHFRVMAYYDFRAGLAQEQCNDQLSKAFGDEAPSQVSVIQWYSEFKRASSLNKDKANSDTEELLTKMKKNNDS